MADGDQSHATLVHLWFEEVWNQGKLETIDKMLGADCLVEGVVDGKGGPIRGPVAFKPFVQNFRAAFPDIKCTIVDYLVQGDKVAARCLVQGTHTGDNLGIKATGKTVEFTGICIAQLSDGQFVGAWNNFDFLKMYQQIGLLPAL